MAHIDGVERRVSVAILSGVDGADKVKCTSCGVTSLRHGGAMLYSNIMFNVYILYMANSFLQTFIYIQLS